jgi:hypothetical protein
VPIFTLTFVNAGVDDDTDVGVILAENASMIRRCSGEHADCQQIVLNTFK